MKLKGKDEKQKFEDPEEDPAPNGTKRKRKRGAPVGHRGNNRPAPDNITNIEVVQPPAEYDCGCRSKTNMRSLISR